MDHLGKLVNNNEDGGVTIRRGGDWLQSLQRCGTWESEEQAEDGRDWLDNCVNIWTRHKWDRRTQTP